MKSSYTEESDVIYYIPDLEILLYQLKLRVEDIKNIMKQKSKNVIWGQLTLIWQLLMKKE